MYDVSIEVIRKRSNPTVALSWSGRDTAGRRWSNGPSPLRRTPPRS
jgi:hypothetical protein